MISQLPPVMYKNVIPLKCHNSKSSHSLQRNHLLWFSVSCVNIRHCRSVQIRYPCVLHKPIASRSSTSMSSIFILKHPSVSIPNHLPPWVPMNIANGAGWSDEAWRKVKHQSEYKRVRHKSRFIRLVFQPSVRGLSFCRLHSWAAYCWPAPAVVVVAAVASGASCLHHPPTFAFHTFQFEWEKSGSNSVTLKRRYTIRGKK